MKDYEEGISKYRCVVCKEYKDHVRAVQKVCTDNTRPLYCVCTISLYPESQLVIALR